MTEATTISQVMKEFCQVEDILSMKTCNKIAVFATSHDMLDVLIDAYAQGATLHVLNIPMLAAYHGSLQCLKYAHKQGCRWDKRTTTAAAKNNHLACLMYAVTNGCPVRKDILSIIAKNGNLEIIKYLHKQGYKWTLKTTCIIASYGYLDCLQYAIENQCKIDKTVASHSAIHGHFDCLQYILKCGCPYDEDSLLVICSESNYISIIDWICERSCSKWKAQHIAYVKQLTSKDRMALALYTGNLFFRAINATHQGLLDLSLLPLGWQKDVSEYCTLNDVSFNAYSFTYDEFVDFVLLLSKHINALICSAPSIDKPVVVYRGVKTLYFVVDFVNNPDQTFIHTGFISTSLDKKFAMSFAVNQHKQTHYMMFATLQPGTKCLFFPAEAEVLLPLNTHLKIIKKTKCKYFQANYQVEFMT